MVSHRHRRPFFLCSIFHFVHFYVCFSFVFFFFSFFVRKSHRKGSIVKMPIMTIFVGGKRFLGLCGQELR